MSEDNGHKSVDSNLIRTVLKNEVTQFLAIASVVFTLVKLVILPIQEMQIRLAQVQGDILEIKGYKTDIAANTNAISVLNSQIKDIQDQLKKK